jgi:hypothetical protein
MLGKGDGEGEGEPKPAKKPLPMGKGKERPEKSEEGEGEEKPGKPGKSPFPPQRGTLRDRFIRRQAQSAGGDYDVVPKTDNIGLAHKERSKDPVVKQVHNVKEVQDAVHSVARKMPRGLQGSQRTGVQGGPDEKAYYKKMYNDAGFAAELVKDYSDKSKKADADEAAVQMKRAMDLALEMQEKNLISGTVLARDEQVRKIYAMDDKGFANLQGIVRNVQAQLEIVRGHCTVKVVEGTVRGFIDSVPVCYWTREELPLHEGQIVASSLKAAMGEMEQADSEGRYDPILNAHLSGKAVVEPVAMLRVVNAGQIDDKSVGRHSDNPALRRALGYNQ